MEQSLQTLAPWEMRCVLLLLCLGCSGNKYYSEYASTSLHLREIREANRKRWTGLESKVEEAPPATGSSLAPNTIVLLRRCSPDECVCSDVFL